MKNLKSALASAAIALSIIVSGCASIEGPDAGDILAQMHDSSQLGGE
jgi:hypothetical protein